MLSGFGRLGAIYGQWIWLRRPSRQLGLESPGYKDARLIISSFLSAYRKNSQKTRLL
jgi:hypothetical protein